ncbi:hypothetical protein [Lentilactobacillus sp. Marseille-Q4993]|uniref:hypothetical protein n=1 Tax=Lentilactobacillus sp. Marseille-Q4993 TaxID=3039492 RepID=UPI0024BC7D6F|nr:hypothetical protein [Lentilactobacillus sp. Marseille-Q4993]
MMDEKKLAAIVAVFKKYNIEVITEGLKITKINGTTVEVDATTYMQDQLIDHIFDVLKPQLQKQVFDEEVGSLYS